MKSHAVALSDFRNERVALGVLHVEFIADRVLGATFTHAEKRGAVVTLHFSADVALVDVRTVVDVHAGDEAPEQEVKVAATIDGLPVVAVLSGFERIE